MNFTREPIIETIITPKEGFKLSVRSSKGESQEEYLVDSIEVVSFGHSFFFRSTERPKSFLVPVSDYEIVEVKETRVALKNAQVERSIKIGGGREAPVRAQREEKEEAVEEAGQEGEPGAPSEGRPERRRDRRHRRRRGGRSSDERQPPEGQRWQERPRAQGEEQQAEAETTEQGGGKSDEAQVSSSIFSTLIPPPTTLISETIGRYKDKDTALSERDILPKPLIEDEDEEEEEMSRKEDDDDEDGSSGSGGSHLSRMTTTTHSYEGSLSFLGQMPPPFGSSFS